MSPIGRPKKDKKQLPIVVALGLLRHSNKPCNHKNEVVAHLNEDDQSNSVELVERENPSNRHNCIFKNKSKT